MTEKGRNPYFDNEWVNPGFFKGFQGVEPSINKGSVPKGKYEIPDPNDPMPIQGQNEAADFLANKGYNLEMLPNKKGGNGWGIKATSNPDFLIEGDVFDCYTPKSGTTVRNVASTIQGKTLSQTQNVVLNLEYSDLNISDITKQLAEYPIDTLNQLIIIKNGNCYFLSF